MNQGFTHFPRNHYLCCDSNLFKGWYCFKFHFTILISAILECLDEKILKYAWKSAIVPDPCRDNIEPIAGVKQDLWSWTSDTSWKLLPGVVACTGLGDVCGRCCACLGNPRVINEECAFPYCAPWSRGMLFNARINELLLAGQMLCNMYPD